MWHIQRNEPRYVEPSVRACFKSQVDTAVEAAPAPQVYFMLTAADQGVFMLRRIKTLLPAVALAILSSSAFSQEYVTPNHVTSKPILEMGGGNAFGCGIRWHNIVLPVDRSVALDYDIVVEGDAWLKKGKVTTIAWATRYTNVLNSRGIPVKHYYTAPVDFYFFIQGDPKTYELSSAPTLPKGYFGGTVASKGNLDIAMAPIFAIIDKKPILAYLVFDRPSGKQTLIFRLTENSLSKGELSALQDCFFRMGQRINVPKSGH